MVEGPRSEASLIRRAASREAHPLYAELFNGPRFEYGSLLPEMWRRLLLIRTAIAASLLGKALELLDGNSGLAEDGAHRAAGDFTVVRDDDDTPVWAAQLHVAATLAGLLEAGLGEREYGRMPVRRRCRSA